MALSSPLLLRMEHITKNFGATWALDDVDFDLRRAEVHALLGENGAGKSTLIKILSGAIKPTRGKMYMDGLPYSPTSPLEGRRMGISVIYQELNLAPHLSVEENIMLGEEWHTLGWLHRRRMREKVRQALYQIHHPEIDPEIPVHRLGVASRQVVEIARALLQKARILVMDEPTSSLSAEDASRLFEIIGQLKRQGVSIIYISHFLEEVERVADRFTVLRDGKKVGSGSLAETSVGELIQMMVGREMQRLFLRPDHPVGEPILTVGRLRAKRMKKAIDLTLHRGEILGVAGLVGSGRTEFLRAVFGLETLEEGVICVAGQEMAGDGPRERIARGIGFLSEDRQGEGLALDRSIADNITLSHLRPYSRSGFLRLAERRKSVQRWMNRMKIRARHPEEPVLRLSGGNQQKVALARLLHQEADVLLLDEPTRGIDIVSKSHVYEWMGQLAAQGKSILFVSSYFPELLGVCDRIAVFHRGELVEIKPVSEWDEQSLMAVAVTGKAAAGGKRGN